METLTSKKFLESKAQSLGGISDNRIMMLSVGAIEALLDLYADLKVKESRIKPEASVIAVKNINCDFEILRDMLDSISPGFIVEKDSFIFNSTADNLYARLNELKKTLSANGTEIVVNKIM